MKGTVELNPLQASFLHKESPDLQFFKSGNDVRTLEASGELVYFSANGGKRYLQAMPLEGIVYLVDQAPPNKSLKPTAR